MLPVIGPREKALVEIETFAVTGGAASSRSGRAALAWVAKNRAAFAANCNYISPRRLIV